MFGPPPALPTRPAQAGLEASLLDALGFDEGTAARLAAAWEEEEDGGVRARARPDHASTTPPPPPLARSAHAAYLRTGLRRLPVGFLSLSAGRPWIVYWVAHGLALLGEPLAGADAAGEDGLR